MRLLLPIAKQRQRLSRRPHVHSKRRGMESLQTVLVICVAVVLLSITYRLFTPSTATTILSWLREPSLWGIVAGTLAAAVSSYGVLHYARRRGWMLILEIVSSQPGLSKDEVLDIANARARKTRFKIPRIPGLLEDCIPVLVHRGELSVNSGKLFLNVPDAKQITSVSPLFDSSKTQRLSIFISYRHADTKAVAGRLADMLQSEQYRMIVHKDLRSNIAGLDFREQLNALVEKSSAMLVLIGKHWDDHSQRPRGWTPCGADDFVCTEIRIALDRRLPVIPVLYDREHLPQQLPSKLSDLAFRHTLQLRDDPFFSDDVGRIVSNIVRAIDELNRSV